MAPLLAFLAAALTLARALSASGLVERVAFALARRAHGRGLVLYVLVCALCAVLTAVVSLDGAVVLMIPLVSALARRYALPSSPYFLGVVAVANAASIAVPQGNPTNLVVIDRLGLSPLAFAEHMFLPGLAAATLCAAGVAVAFRGALGGGFGFGGGGRAGAPPPPALSPVERHAAASVAIAGAVAWTSPLLGIAPWWPFAAAVAATLALGPARRLPTVPWRTGVQVSGLLIGVSALVLPSLGSRVLSLPALLAISAAVGAISATANNLPVSVCVAGLLGVSGTAYAASIGLAVGALATPQGSIATLIATDMAGPEVAAGLTRRLAPLAAVGLAVATTLMWLLL